MLSEVWDGSSQTRPDPSVFRAPDGADYARIVEELKKTQSAILVVDAQFAAEAADFIRAGNAVRIRETDGKLKLASSDTGGIVAGVALNTDNIVFFVHVGRIEIEDWTLVTGDEHLEIGRPYYLGLNGTLQTNPVVTGYHIKIGLAISETIFAVKISESVRL